MSSGGMDWAYRMIALHGLDPLGLAVVLHLGWRDAVNQRTTRGIARALGQHETSIRKAVDKLAAAGIIARRSGQWVAVETIRIVEQAPDAPRPSPEAADPDAQLSCAAGRRRVRNSVEGGCATQLRATAQLSGALEKENVEKEAASPISFRDLSPFARSCLSAGKPVPLGGGRSLVVGSPGYLALEAEALRQRHAGEDAAMLPALGRRGGSEPARLRAV